MSVDSGAPTVGGAGEGRSLGREASPSPRTSSQSKTTPEWLRVLLPMVPSPLATPDDEDLAEEAEGDDDRSATPIFPLGVASFVASQTIKLDLLQACRLQLVGDGAKQRRARHKFTSLRLDVKLLLGLADLFSFASSALELVHHGTTAELGELQRNNLRLMDHTTRLLQSLMRTDELKVDLRDPTSGGGVTAAPSAASHSRIVNISDRLAEHNSAEVMLTVFESLVGQVASAAEPDEEPLHGGSTEETSSLRALQTTVVESILRCLDTQLESCSAGSVHRVNLLKQLYWFIPSHLQMPPPGDATPAPGEGSESEVIHILVELVRSGHLTHSSSVAALSARILAHVASTPIPNDHVHAPTCQKPPSRSACTRGTPSSPVITYPPHANSSLGVASALFLFPHSPPLYLVEKCNLVAVYLEKLRPFLQPPIAAADTTSPRVTPKLVARSLFGKSTPTESSEGPLAWSTGLFQPPNSSLPLSEEEHVAHHASFTLSEHRFMLDSYTRSPIADCDVPQQYPSHDATRPPSSALPPSLHPRGAPVWQSNEILASVLHGLAALCTSTGIISQHVCSQPGMLAFLDSLLSHSLVQLNLVAARLIDALERGLTAPRCVMHGADCEAPSLTAYLNGLKRSHPPRLSRRNSGAGLGRTPVFPRRRNSLSNSPQLIGSPGSPLHKAAHSSFSPKLLALAEPLLSATLGLPRSEAHIRLAPLVTRSVQLLVGMMRLQWPSARNQAPAVSLDAATQLQITSLLGSLIQNLESRQHQAAPTVPILARLLLDPVQPSAMREACLTSLAHLCTLHAPNRRVVIEAQLIAKVVVPLLAVLKPLDVRRLKDRSELVHPSVLSLQLACVRLCASLGDSFTRAASDQLTVDDAHPAATPMSHMLVQLHTYLERDSPLTLRVAASALLHQLVAEESPLREVLLKAGLEATFARLGTDEAGTDGIEADLCCTVPHPAAVVDKQPTDSSAPASPHRSRSSSPRRVSSLLQVECDDDPRRVAAADIEFVEEASSSDESSIDEPLLSSQQQSEAPVSITPLEWTMLLARRRAQERSNSGVDLERQVTDQAASDLTIAGVGRTDWFDALQRPDAARTRPAHRRQQTPRQPYPHL